jgi:hypothetical protein
MLKKIIFSTLLLFSLFYATNAFAADICFTPQIPIPGMSSVFTETCGNGGYKITGTSIGQFIIVVYKYSIGIIGILAAIVLMWGGVVWLTAGGNQQRVSEAQAWIKASLTGLVLALCSFLILSTINPDLTVFKSISPAEIKAMKICCKECSGEGCGLIEAIATKENNVINYTCPPNTNECTDGKTCVNVAAAKKWECYKEITMCCSNNDNKTCPAGTICNMAKFTPPACTYTCAYKSKYDEACAEDLDCEIDFKCINKKCKYKSGPHGAKCDSNDQCASKKCVEIDCYNNCADSDEGCINNCLNNSNCGTGYTQKNCGCI